jgi:Cu(I)/Ag(I) efflux system membrane fusion protein
MERRSRKLWLGILIVGAAAGGAGYYFYQRARSESAQSTADAHEAGTTPAATATQPGMAGMPAADSASPTPSQGAGEIFIAPERRQLIGVKSVPAELRNLSREIRTAGRIAQDETRITHIHTKISGFIEEVFVDYVGKSVRKGEPLFSIYSPDLVATQEEYLLALRSTSVLNDSSFPWIAKGSTNLLEAARRRLLLWDISPEDIAILEKEGQVKRALTIYSPVSGIVTERAAYHHGRHVTPEMDLYTIVDLSTVWVLGEVYEYELPFLKVGQTAQVEFPYNSGVRPRTGRIAFISPTLDPKTRTAEVRMEFANPDLTLRPGTFVNLQVDVNLGRHVSIPIDALLQSGTDQYVFVDKGEGYFEPRSVKVGPQAGEYYAIESGLKSGELVVTAANFILDSESRLKGAFAGMGAPSSVQATPPAAARAQNLSVEILEPKTAKVGGNDIRLAVKDPSGKPIEGAEVEVTLFMPQMGNMAPMTSKANLKDSGGGTYDGSIHFPMAWTWDTTVTVKKSGQPLGSAKTTITAR